MIDLLYIRLLLDEIQLNSIQEKEGHCGNISQREETVVGGSARPSGIETDVLFHKLHTNLTMRSRQGANAPLFNPC